MAEFIRSGKRPPEIAELSCQRIAEGRAIQWSNAPAAAMRQQGAGSIISVTSISAELGFPDNPAYGTARGALNQLTRSLAFDQGPHGIRVNNLAPGRGRTCIDGGWLAKGCERAPSAHDPVEEQVGMTLGITPPVPVPAAPVKTRWRSIRTAIPAPDSIPLLERLRRVEPQSATNCE